MSNFRISEYWYHSAFEISIDSIISYKIKKIGKYDYSNGGWYFIFNNETGSGYIGKSKDYMGRLKSHIYNAKKNKGILIDIEMGKNIKSFRFFLIKHYNDIPIDYDNRILENAYEKKLITHFGTKYPTGYNQTNLKDV